MDITQDKQNQSLASKSISALKWNYIGRMVSLSLQFTIGKKSFSAIKNTQKIQMISVVINGYGLFILFFEKPVHKWLSGRY